jgi:hypothetical protein
MVADPIDRKKAAEQSSILMIQSWSALDETKCALLLLTFHAVVLVLGCRHCGCGCGVDEVVVVGWFIHV